MVESIKQTRWAIIILCLAAVPSQALTIDTFEDGPALLNFRSAGPVSFPATSALGGWRTLQIMGYPTDSDPIHTGVRLQVGRGVLGHSQDAFAPGGRSMTTWDANGAGLGGIDLTSNGQDNSFAFELVSIDVGSVDVTWTVKSDTHGTAELRFEDLNRSITSVSFTDFDNYNPLIFQNTDSISMMITTGWASDLVLDLLGTSITITPQPTALAFTVTALAGLGATRRGRPRFS